MALDLGDDPGWQLSIGTFSFLLPGRLAKSGLDPLQLTRNVFVSFCAAAWLIGLVVIVLGDIDPTRPDRPGLAVAIVVGVGLICLALQRTLPRPLDCTTPATLAASYQTRFFLRIAFAETCALAAFVVFVALGPGWVYAVGLAFAMVGFAAAAPAQANLRADQDSLSTTGCTLSLVAALRSPGAGGASLR